MGYYKNNLALKMRIENISAAKVAAVVGLHENTVDRIRRKNNPNLKTMAKIATAMNWNGGELLEWVMEADE